MRLRNNTIRVGVTPLTGSLTVTEGNPGSPLQQVYDGKEYQPDRTVQPCTVIPTLDLKAPGKDGLYTVSNDDMGDATQMSWLVDGVDISQVSGWKDAYSISDGKTAIDGTVYTIRGTLVLTYNVPAGEKHALVFQCVVVDRRTGRQVTMQSDAVYVGTFDKAEDTYKLEMSGGVSVAYNPWTDEYSRLMYKRAHGETVQGSTMDAARDGETSYVKTWTFAMSKGAKKLTAGTDYSLEYFVNEGSGYQHIGKDIDADLTPVTEYDNVKISVDMRMMETCQLLCRAYHGGRLLGEQNFGTVRVHPTFTADYMNGTDVNPTDKKRYDRLIVKSGNQAIEHFSRLLETEWHVMRSDGVNVVVGYGDDVTYDLEGDAGMNTSVESEIGEYANVEERENYDIASDKDGNIWTDSEGNILIFH